MSRVLTSGSLIQNLNPEQHKAVMHTKGPLLLVAGAGSGKTMVITHRIAQLIQSEVAKPWEILGVTFTNKAAAEMNERVRNLTDQDVLIATFHSFGARLLRQHGYLLGLKPGFTIFDSVDQKALIKECLKVLDVPEEKFKASSVAGKISRLKDELVDPSTYEGFANAPYEQVISQVYMLYEKRLKENNALDFSDLIFSTVKLLGTEKDVLEHYQTRFKFLMVDEYQDTNYAQYQLVKLLAQKHHNLCVVGDPDQSIYSWRGADIRNIMNFEKDYLNTTVISLEENYRSTANILNAANKVIQKNLNRKPKNLRTTREAGTPLFYYQAMDGRDEADFVVKSIKDSCSQGIPIGEMAVLYRVHALSRSMEEALMNAQIPYRILGGMKFYDRKEVKDILAYLRFVANPADRMSFNRIINVPKRGLGPSTVAKIQNYSYEKQISFAEALNQCELISGITTRILNKLKPFISLIADLKMKMDTVPVSDLLENLLTRIKYFDYLKMDDPATFTTREDNIKELFAAVAEYEQRHESPTLTGYLEEVSLLTDTGNAEQGEEALVLMTIHNAKGLEYRTCFLIGLDEGIFPYGSAQDSEEDMEEERRLCYVGITRAKDTLYLTSCMRRLMYGRWKTSQESRFLRDIPKELLTFVGSNTSSFEADESEVPIYNSFVQKLGQSLKPEPAGSQDYYVGAQVFHDKWGVGQVISIQGTGEQIRVRVLFGQGYGAKDLMLKYANLSRI
jgi:DNA helicase-2/ATP-dependent DNA helicase PcrA